LASNYKNPCMVSAPHRAATELYGPARLGSWLTGKTLSTLSVYTWLWLIRGY
jgi:hypothetical protein